MFDANVLTLLESNYIRLDKWLGKTLDQDIQLLDIKGCFISVKIISATEIVDIKYKIFPADTNCLNFLIHII